MERIWIILYLALALLVIVQAALMALQTWENRRFARNRLRELDRCGPVGHATVFAPCKGLDLGLENNLRALLDQDYRDLEVVFVVESPEDSACPVIRRVMRDYSGVRTRLIVAGRSSGSGQKVHNLRVATKDLPPGTDYLVFMDSDARPRREWLRLLLSDLDSPRVGATTGYRWFLPLRPSLANHLVYSINCGIALLMGRGGRHLVWGGSWAPGRVRSATTWSCRGSSSASGWRFGSIPPARSCRRSSRAWARCSVSCGGSTWWAAFMPPLTGGWRWLPPPSQTSSS